MPENDVDDAGGAAATTTQVSFLDFSETGTFDVVSADAGDDGTAVTVYGRDASGASVDETVNLSSAAPVAGSQEFAYVDKIVLGAACAGQVVVRRSPGIETTATILPGTTDVRKPFYAAAANPTVRRVFYEKVFFSNDSDPAVALSAPAVMLGSGAVAHSGTARAGGAQSVDLATDAVATSGHYADMLAYIVDGTGAGQFDRIASYDGPTRRATMADLWTTQPDATSVVEIHALSMNLESSVNGTEATANRLTAPAALVSGGWRPATEQVVVPGGTLDPTDAVGVWLRLVEPAAGAPLLKRQFTLLLRGTP